MEQSLCQPQKFWGSATRQQTSSALLVVDIQTHNCTFLPALQEEAKPSGRLLEWSSPSSIPARGAAPPGGHHKELMVGRELRFTATNVRWIDRNDWQDSVSDYSFKFCIFRETYWTTFSALAPHSLLYSQADMRKC